MEESQKIPAPNVVATKECKKCQAADISGNVDVGAFNPDDLSMIKGGASVMSKNDNFGRW